MSDTNKSKSEAHLLAEFYALRDANRWDRFFAWFFVWERSLRRVCWVLAGLGICSAVFSCTLALWFFGSALLVSVFGLTCSIIANFRV